VYISPADTGRIKRDWKPLMQETNLIWISANRSGNNTHTSRRVSYALLALTVMGRNYQIDKSRIYISGFSGGGRTASYVATEYPQLFKGAIYICGVLFWGDDRTIAIDEVRKNRYVFLTGTKDFNLRDTKQVFKKYGKAGVEQVKLMVIPHMGHSNPRYSDYSKAIAWLDGEVEE
jgi:predicted peptidase